MSTVVYKNVHILDGTKNMKLARNKCVIVEDNKIKDICDTVSENCKVIDLEGAYMIPGLINLHCHLPGSGNPSQLSSANLGDLVHKLLHSSIGKMILNKMCYNYAKMELLSGVTTLRTVGGLGCVDSTIRDAINKGKKVGPTILASDTAISVPGGHMAGLMAYAATSVEDAVAYVDEIAKTKPDLIKIMITGGVLDGDDTGKPGAMKMSEEMVKAICDRAHTLGFSVAAHVESYEGVKVALLSGVDTIEHGAELDEELVNLFKEKKAKLICTISPAVPMRQLDVSMLPDENYKINGTIVCDGIISATKSALANDIEVGMGNDVGCPYVTHYDFWRELVYFQHYIGVSNLETLHIATLKNAQIAKVDDKVGSIEIGKNADFIILKENPADNLKALRNISMVVKNGKVVKGKVKRKVEIDKVLDSMSL